VAFVVASSVTLVTLDDPGLTWDEPFSIVPGRVYAAWFGDLLRLPFGRQAIHAYWSPNHEHPPLAKLLMGAAQALLGDGQCIVASRSAVAVLFALLVVLVLQFGSRAFGGLAGLMAAASLMCMPRVFGHAHFAALDVPMALTWLLAVVTFRRAINSGAWRASALSGLCFGLALLTKINAVFLPLVLVGWGLGFHGKRAIRPLLWTFGVGAVVFFVGWPWLWYETAARLWGYLRPTWRTPIPLMYFGEVYADKAAPWHYPIVLTMTTIPVGILFLVLVGTAKAVRRLKDSPMLALLVINVAVAIGPFMLPWLPKYDGVRLFLPAFPFLALLAGVGGQRCWAWVAERWRRRPRLPLCAAAVFFLSQAGAVALIHPCELSYYNALVGGLWGAEKLGLETTYWHDVVNRRLFRWLNRHGQVGHRIAFYPVGEFVVRTDPREFDFYDAYHLNRPRAKRHQAVRLEPGVDYDLVVLNAREAMLRRHEEAWRMFTTQKPLFAIRKQGVLLCAVYRRR